MGHSKPWREGLGGAVDGNSSWMDSGLAVMGCVAGRRHWTKLYLCTCKSLQTHRS